LSIPSRLIALADPEQRIYDFIGADPERLNHFRDAFQPTELDFSSTNHRSVGTDIVKFGNDILTGNFEQESYVGIAVDVFEPYPDPAMTMLVTKTYEARKRLVERGKSKWSLAILVPTKKMTRLVSDKFREPPAGMQAITHNAVIELEAAILGSEIIAHLMQPDGHGHFDVFVELMCNYYQGKGGDRPTKGSLKEADGLRRAYGKWCVTIRAGKNPPGNSVIKPSFAVYEAARAVELIGDPDQDWRAIRAVLECGSCKRLKEIGTEVRNIRLLERGTQLRQALTQDWRDNGFYANALAIVRQAFVQEHFATGSKPDTGVVIMNMHKAKGKQFDEVIIFEGWPRRDKKNEIVANLDRFVRNNDRAQINDSSRQNFRVSVTRGRQKTTILTPRFDPCVLLLPNK
jgi:DNA helicase II / ATP-dependent DNA helicase PcrA